MGFMQKISEYSQNSYMKKYGDRLTQAQGKVLSIKVETKTVLWIFHKIKATIVIKPEYSKNIVTGVYAKQKWFKKPEFMNVQNGHSVILQGLKSDGKSKKNKNEATFKETISIINIRNFTTRKDLVPNDAPFEMPKMQTKVRHK